MTVERASMTADWIEQYADYDHERRRHNLTHRLARTIYPTPFGEMTEPDEKGCRYPVYPRHTAAWFAQQLTDEIDRRGLIA